MRKNLSLLSLLLPLAVFSAECVKLSEGLYRLENEYVRADITAAGGARCLSLVDKRTGLEYTSPASDMGIGGECDWQEKKMKNSIWFGKPYAVQGTQKGDRAEIRLQRSGTGVVGQWMTITKTIALDDKSTEIEFLYDIAVRAEAMKTISFYPWLHNSVQLASEPVKMIFAKTNGINSINFKPNWPLNESFHYDMADSWVAVSRLKHPSGVVLQTPYRDMMCFYNWQGEEGNTIEQMFHEQQIKAGTSYAAPMKLTFYNGLDTVDGADAGVVAQFIDGGVRIYAAYSDAAEVTVSARKPPELIERTIGVESVKLQFGKTQEVRFQSAVLQGEELIVRVKTSRGTMTMRKPFGIKDYKRPPVEKRIGRESDRFGMVFLNTESTKECYDWPSELPVVNGNALLKPDANGRLRILVVTDMIAGREAYELAGRMGAELSSCTFSTSGYLKWHPQWGHSGGLPESNVFLENKLKEDYDAIIFGGQQFSVLTEKNMEAIKAKVSNGTALITVTPRMIPKKYADMFPVTPQADYVVGTGKVTFRAADSFKVGDDSPIRNFPYKSLGFVPLFPYAPQKASVTCGNGQPFFAMAPFGKGRVASFTWLNGLKENTTRAGIIPLFEDEPELPWHNVFYGMVIKATQAALGRSPKLAIRDFHADAKSLKLTIDNTLDRMMNANCLLTVYHSCSSNETRTLPVSLKPGRNEIALPMDISLSAMQSLVEVRLMADGLAFDFAYDTVDNPNGCLIEWKNKINGPLLASSQYALDFDFKGTYDKADAVLQDRYGRILATGTADGGRIALAPHGAVEHRAELTVRLHAAGRVVASRVFIVDIVPEKEFARAWDGYKVMLSWPVRDTRVMPFHLRTTWQETMKDLGIDLVMTYGIPVGTGGDQPANYMLNYRYVGPLVMESITRLSKSSGIDGFNYPLFDYRNRKRDVANMLDKFAKTNDPLTFQRYPRLDDDAYLNAYTAAMDKWIPSILQWRPFMFDLGDEMSYGQFGVPLDFDFSPEGLTMFRKWLRQRYNDDLARLNAEWRREFKSWDDVMPDTGNEARTRGVYAGWALQRIYNTGLFANFWKVVSDHARKLDPGVRISASGTPPSNAYNGYDYEKLMPTVDSLIAYTLNGLAEIIASFKKAPLMSWVGYGSPESEVWQQIWDNAFNGHYGVGFYSEMTMVNPNLTLTSHGATVRDAAKPLRDDGVGTLLFHCDSTPTALIHYSLPSMMLSHGLKTFNAFALSHGQWVAVLKERNCNPRFITPNGIMRGELVASGVKCLVLPNSAALSDGELAELRKFAARGGQIIADMQPGLYNENCALAPEERLKDVPIWTLGQNLVQDPNAPIMRKLSAHLDEIIPRRRLTLTSKDGNPQIHSYRLCGEGGEVYGVWPSRPSVVNVSVMEGATVYDVMGGRTVWGDVSLKANRPGVFVVLPYKVAGVEVKRSLDGAGAKRALAIDASIRSGSGREPLRHVLQFRIFDGDGNELDYHRRTMNAPNGRARMTIHLAENEDSSRWTVKVTDMISKASND